MISLNRREKLIYLHSCQGIYWKTINRFIDNEPSLSMIDCLREDELVHHYRMTPSQARTFLSAFHNGNPQQLFSDYRKQRIQVITIFDKEYPHFLKEIYDPPWVLYLKGDASIICHSKKILSIVGTRTPSANGVESLKKILPPLIDKKYAIVSGMAYGIDTLAHRFTHELGGKTAAVLGSGFLHIYPRKHLPLSELLANHHLLVSEYPPYTKPRKWHFPERNRIISGLAIGTLVVEAKKRSGSLITADQALEQGRDIFAVPGSIIEPNAEGTNHLIQQGAKLVLNAEDILFELPE